MQINSPFQDVIGDPVFPLHEFFVPNGQPGIAKTVIKFKFCPEQIELLKKKWPSYKLQLRMFRLDTVNIHADDFPLFYKINLNGKDVELPEFVQNLQTSLQRNRRSRHIDVTSYFQTENLTEENQLEIEWLNDQRKWVLGIWFILPLPPQTSCSKYLTTITRRSANVTKKKIEHILDGKSNALDQLKISLLCPISKTRMTIPARSKFCSHLPCFDLPNFLEMNKKTPAWKCPICNEKAHFDRLIIDQFFVDLLKTVELNVEEVELQRDGSWKILKITVPNLRKSGIQLVEESEAAVESESANNEILINDDSNVENSSTIFYDSESLNQALKACSLQSVDETKKKIAEIWDCDDDGLVMDQLKISLSCPISRTRLKIPARSKGCLHLPCFDLLNFLEMNKKTPSWKCPICNEKAHFDRLIIDQFFVDLLKTVELNVEEVELQRDGSWKILKITVPNLRKSGIQLVEEIEAAVESESANNEIIINDDSNVENSSTIFYNSELLNQALKACSRQSVDETKKKLLKFGTVMMMISRTRLKIPARSKGCSHLPCFDLSNFLEMIEKTPAWKCPICKKNANFENLIIDKYFMVLLKTVELNVEEVEILRNGNLKTVKDASEKIEIVEIENELSQLNLGHEVITLDDSNDKYSSGYYYY